jgi:hypothetical protein
MNPVKKGTAQQFPVQNFKIHFNNIREMVYEMSGEVH